MPKLARYTDIVHRDKCTVADEPIQKSYYFSLEPKKKNILCI